ncbi:DMT family transporter [Roseomonas xinghualingensis]|uniref:DMT family transporter n=1 Tax=Roseomonas xinghualingensis TaxID=2986475 RepID=UPI0021F0DE46|nr:DMT family transporter [Roseomonas sp. SXEYE001]MCV4206574.1 DMT family transporter [Roseomonas sp. SXEYE001]
MSGAGVLKGWPLWWRLLVISAFWASAFPVVRLATRSMPPFAFSFTRSVAAFVAVMGIAWATGAFRGLKLAFWRHGLVLGTANGWLPNCLTAVALMSLGAASVALVQSTTPLFVALLATAFLPAERPGPRTLAGMVLGFAGIAIVLGPQALSGAEVLAGAMMLVVALSYAAGTVYVRRMRPGPVMALAAGQQLVGAVGAGILSLAADPPGSFDQPWSVWGAAVWVGLFTSALPLTLYLALVQRARATDAAMTGYLQPGFAAVFAALLLGEWPEAQVFLGGAVVLAGVWLATGGGGRRG